VTVSLAGAFASRPVPLSEGSRAHEERKDVTERNANSSTEEKPGRVFHE
jgi:hypothetical protein